MDLKSLVRHLEAWSPPNIAESWDNVGLLIEPSGTKVVNKVILTNDLTEEVVLEAVEVKAELILSYHPPIFRPLKRITQKGWKVRVLSGWRGFAVCGVNLILLSITV